MESFIVFADRVSALLPLTQFVLAILIMLPLCTLIGHHTGRKTRERALDERDRSWTPPGETTSGAMLALLGLLLAFTFSFALNRADDRRNALIEEVAAIGTAFLRADLVAEPGRTTLRQVIADYTVTRQSARNRILDQADFDDLIARTLATQERLWPAALEATAGDTPPPIRALVVSGITDVLDAHNRRLSAGTQFIPAFAKIVILFTAATALIVTTHNSALQGRRLSWQTFIFAGLLGIIMAIILDFERPHEGMVRLDVSQLDMLIADLTAQVAATR
jgi:hypothetical protein